MIAPSAALTFASCAALASAGPIGDVTAVADSDYPMANDEF